MHDQDPAAAGPADLLRHLLTEMADDLGAAPTVREVLAVMGAAFPADPTPVKGYRYPVRFLADKAPVDTGEVRARLDDLGDAPFTLASDLLGEVVRRRSAALGRPITYAELCKDLLALLRAVPDGLFSPAGGALASLSVEKIPAVRTLKAGDIVAIPAGPGGVHIGIALARNAFGIAIGFWASTFAAPRVDPVRTAQVADFPPLYTDDDAVADGTWHIIDHDESLLAAFPREPEIYHRPNKRFPQIGEFGAAETSAGALRNITETEAIAVGLADRTYEQTRSSGRVARFLDERSVPGEPSK